MTVDFLINVKPVCRSHSKKVVKYSLWLGGELSKKMKNDMWNSHIPANALRFSLCSIIPSWWNLIWYNEGPRSCADCNKVSWYQDSFDIYFNISGVKNFVCYTEDFIEFDYIEISTVVQVMGARPSVLIQLLRIFSFRFLKSQADYEGILHSHCKELQLVYLPFTKRYSVIQEGTFDFWILIKFTVKQIGFELALKFRKLARLWRYTLVCSTRSIPIGKSCCIV